MAVGISMLEYLKSGQDARGPRDERKPGLIGASVRLADMKVGAEENRRTEILLDVNDLLWAQILRRASG